MGLQEIVIPGATSKGSHYHKAYYTYPQSVETVQIGAIKSGQLLVEINSFANPYPVRQCSIQSFLIEFLIKSGNILLVEEYDMQPFIIPVLDKRRTLTEKLVSLLHFSLADSPIPELQAKIRHFYDLHFLLQDDECRIYLNSSDFKQDFQNLLEHDRQSFSKPQGWQTRSIEDSSLVTNFHELWAELQETYLHELPDLAYQQIPDAFSIEKSVQEIIGKLVEH